MERRPERWQLKQYAATVNIALQVQQLLIFKGREELEVKPDLG
jgi:hypothetical protein